MPGHSVVDIYELSPLQSGMLFHTLYAPESRLYFEQVMVPIEGDVEARLVERAWSAAVAANDVLRTSFHWKEIDKPVQVVHRAAELRFMFRDLRGGSDRHQAAEMASVCEADRQAGFDMAKAPLFRVALLQLAPKSHRLLLSFHHAILDGWSVQHVYRQFLESYAALARGEMPRLTPTRPYKDYIRWLQGQDLQAAEAYWRETFEDHDRGARLPLRPRRDEDDYAAGEQYLSKAVGTALRAYAQRQKLTLKTLVQAAWANLVGRMTGSEVVVFGSIVSGRPSDLAGVDQMVGLFINTLPVRVRVPRAGAVSAWLAALQAAQFAARQFDFSALVDIQAWTGVAKGEALFDTIVAFENYPMQENADRGPKLSLVERTNYPLSLSVTPGERIAIRLLHNRRFFDDAAIERLLAQYASVLEALCADDGARMEELELASAGDRQALVAWNDTGTDYPQTAITDLFDREAATRPGATALQFGARALTYGELAGRANQLAHRLADMGVRRGDRVGLLLEAGIEMVVAMLGTLKAGAAYVPIDLACPAARIACVLGDAAAKVAIASPAMVSRLADVETNVLVLDASFAAIDRESTRPPAVSIGPDDLAYVMFTSGSTGRPKGAIIPHRAVVRLVRDNAYLQIVSTDKVGQASNCAFDAATFEIWGALLNGAAVVGIERDTVLSAGALGGAIRERGITVLFLTTALFNEVVAEQHDALRTLRALLFGGEQVDARRVRQLLAGAAPQILRHVYGPTETTTFALWQGLSPKDAFGDTIPIGRPISNTTAYVLDHAMRPVSPGQVGELYVGGDGLAHGYVGDARATAQSFVPDPFSSRAGARLYRTGDKVRQEEDGSIAFVGRYDDQIKLRGHRVEIGEIDFWLQRQPYLRQSFVMVRQQSSGGKHIVAYVVPNGESSDTQQRLRDALRQHLPTYMQPAAIVVLQALPLTPNGKIDRRALPDPTHSLESADAVDPRTATEERLAVLWRDVLGVQRVSMHDNFFDIGGHSLRATQLVSRIGREFGMEIPLRAVFERPTIAEQVALLEGGEPGSAMMPLPEIKRVARSGSAIRGG
ncbi:MAG TPA: amino acid adenylation domain-containing protein [Xanthobacteraceae bacterium]